MESRPTGSFNLKREKNERRAGGEAAFFRCSWNTTIRELVQIPRLKYAKGKYYKRNNGMLWNQKCIQETP
ncbi:MAG: hypothetical protein CO029_01855 [Candidatus Magasanikbacteria bacterium CG_4_9_14_0_2_um_filter_41_10]|uniref:Uncharacterized protein n=1 Tax=Candidatus Magasanikbacteria bacterium CG_4_10_14_0_2_um_filter_41_31 TaxID=1974639 RepID=A0A2M7V3C9_9BACT|nr:MAG: hypothetical protein COX83_02975 [Candidatus Magasanikbacteria bacterium CG_4_10_14_0_2_um_filter_41_31]PJC53621.1 MAG: hypothetical protein CO029_01855 [Candidatus Magasanikbacteria bacterium CG_4_9_14_0_2_um_filter_41_10]